MYVDDAIDGASLLRLDPDKKLDLDNQDSIILNSSKTSPKTVIEIPTKAYIDSLHEENKRSRRDLGIDFYDENDDLVKNKQTNAFNDNIILNVRSIQINDDPTNDDHAVNKKYVDDEFLNKPDSSLVKNNQNNDFNNNNITNVKSIQITDDPVNDRDCINKKYFNDEMNSNTIVRLNDDSNDRYLQVRVDNISYNLQMYNKSPIIDTTKMIFPNTGNEILQNWKIICNKKYNEGKPSDFIKSTKTNSPTGNSGAN